MSGFRTFAFAVGIAMLLTGSAAAVTIDFDDVAPGVFLDSYTSGGMVFTSLPGGTYGKVLFPPDTCGCDANIDPDGSSIEGDPLIMRVAGGGTFDLLGFTFGIRPTRLGDSPATGFIRLQFLYDGGALETESFDVTHFGPEALALSRTGLRRVAWLRGEIDYDVSTCTFCTHSGGSIGPFLIDDVVVGGITRSPNPTEPPVFPPEQPGPPTTVPEPAAWALLISGFALAGGALRLRRRVA